MSPGFERVMRCAAAICTVLLACAPLAVYSGTTVESDSSVRQTFVNNNARNIGACLADVDLVGDGTLKLVVGAPGSRNPAGAQNVGRTLPLDVGFDGLWSADLAGVSGSPTGDLGNGKFGFRCDSEGARLVVSQNMNARVHVYLDGLLEQTLIPMLQSPAVTEAPNSAVAIRDNVIAFGVPSDDGGRGRVHLWSFSGSSWQPLQVLDSAANAVVDGQYGWSLALGNGLLVVGAPAETTFGRAYAYRRNATTGLFELSAELPVPPQFNAAVASRFGNVIAIDEVAGNHLAVAATVAQMQGLPSATGGIAIYRASAVAASGWTALYGLAPPDGTVAQQFGVSLDLLGDQLLVGDRHNLTTGSVGAVYRFWMSSDFGMIRRVVKYFQPGASAARNFAWAVRLINGAVVVGVPGTFSNANNQSIGQVVRFGEADGVFRDGLEQD